MIVRCVSIIVPFLLLVSKKTTTGFCFNRMLSSSRRFAISNGKEPLPPTRRENTVKTVQFTNMNIIYDPYAPENLIKASITIEDDDDFQSFLEDINAFAVEDPEGIRFRSLDLIDADKEYTLIYSERAGERW